MGMWGVGVVGCRGAYMCSVCVLVLIWCVPQFIIQHTSQVGTRYMGLDVNIERFEQDRSIFPPNTQWPKKWGKSGHMAFIDISAERELDSFLADRNKIFVAVEC